MKTLFENGSSILVRDSILEVQEFNVKACKSPEAEIRLSDAIPGGGASLFTLYPQIPAVLSSVLNRVR